VSLGRFLDYSLGHQSACVYGRHFDDLLARNNDTVLSSHEIRCDSELPRIIAIRPLDKNAPTCLEHYLLVECDAEIALIACGGGTQIAAAELPEHAV
jgi:hypothetical protein